MFHEGLIRIYLLRDLLKKSLTLSRIKLFNEIKIVTGWLFTAETILTALILGLTFVFSMLCTCTVYFGMKSNNLSVALPAFVLTFGSVAFIQVIFKIGCNVFSYSSYLIKKWEEEASLYQRNDMSKREICKIVKSFRIISVPSGNVGIIDIDIKMNYMDNLLQNIAGLVLTLKDVFP